MTIAIVTLSILCLVLLLTSIRLNSSLSSARVDNATVTQQLAAAQADLARIQSETAERARIEEERFRNLANDILKDSRSTLRDESSRQIEEILKPLRDNLNSFNRSVEEKYSREAQERFALREKIDELRLLNDTIGRDARELSQALRGNSKVQGEWGEMILESLLTKAGFCEGREFTLQHSTTDDNGRQLRPDVVVSFPPDNCIVIDSKVSLTAYVNWANADSATNRDIAGRAHVASVRKHINELARKNYQDYVGSAKLDFVMMFIPNEAAYLAAIQLEPGLWQEAYDSRVLIISPTHLFSVLKLVQQMWRHDAQTRHAIEIATEGGKLYDKFVGFVDDMLKIEKAIYTSSEACRKAIAKLSTGPGNLIRRAENMRTLGAKATKTLQINDKESDEGLTVE